MKKSLFLLVILACAVAISALPVSSFFEAFDASDSMPNGWSTIVQSESTVSNVWVHTAAYDAYSGTNMIKMFGNTDDPQDILVLVSPEVTNLSDNPLSFWAKSSWGEVTDSLMVGTLSDPNDYSTFNHIATYGMGIEYAQFTIDFDPANTDSYIAFVNPLTSDYGYATYIEDVSWEPSAIVPGPAIAIAPEENATDVLINFADNMMTFPFEWSSTGGNPTGYKLSFGTDNPPTNFMDNVDLGNVSTYAPTVPLNYTTQYFWQITPYNEFGDAVNCPVWGFSTQSGTTIDFRTVNSWSEGFETAEVGFLPLGMEQENVNDDNAQWAGIATSDWSPNAHTGSMAVHMAFAIMNSHDDYLYTPPMYMVAGNTYTIDFWYKISAFENSFEKMDIYVGDSPVNTAMVDQVWDNNYINNVDYMQGTCTYVAQEDGIKFIGFHAYSDALQMVLLLDDITVTQQNTSPNADDVVNVNTLSVSNYPNPFNPETTFEFSIPKGQTGSLTIYNLRGQAVKSYTNLTSNDNKIVWQGKDSQGSLSPSGTYFYRLSVGNDSRTGRMTLLK